MSSTSTAAPEPRGPAAAVTCQSDHPHQAGGAAFAVRSAVRLGLAAEQVRLFAG